MVFTHSLVELCKLELAELQLDGIEVLTMYQFYKSTKNGIIYYVMRFRT